ncbi:MAG: hypothetical protein FWF08_06735 [Oscillospiraceae bacterium]|nr:hypothetical protein [Oscillospiraceae bacterium]
MKMAITQNLNNFNFRETKKNISNYFMDIEKIKWEQARLSVQKGLVAKHEVAPQDKKGPYISIGKDEFNLLAKAEKSEELKNHLSGYYWAKTILTEQEQLYITEYFINGKYEDEVVGILGLDSSESNEFRKLKRRAIYKFAYVLNLVV